jgi:hypothetical protein
MVTKLPGWYHENETEKNAGSKKSKVLQNWVG